MTRKGALHMYDLMINNKSFYTDYGLILTEVKIATPTPKRITVNIQGADGLLELTPEPLRYSNRSLDFVFRKGTNDFTEWESISARMLADVNGYHDDITIREIGGTSPKWHWKGSVTVSGIKITPHIGTFSVKVDAYPYQLSDVNTVSRTIGTGWNNISITNEGSKPITELIVTNSNEVQLKYSDTTVTISAGTHSVYAFSLPQGENIIQAKATSSGTSISVSWTEERL